MNISNPNSDKFDPVIRGSDQSTESLSTDKDSLGTLPGHGVSRSLSGKLSSIKEKVSNSFASMKLFRNEGQSRFARSLSLNERDIRVSEPTFSIGMPDITSGKEDPTPEPKRLSKELRDAIAEKAFSKEINNFTNDDNGKKNYIKEQCAQGNKQAIALLGEILSTETDDWAKNEFVILCGQGNKTAQQTLKKLCAENNHKAIELALEQFKSPGGRQGFYKEIILENKTLIPLFTASKVAEETLNTHITYVKDLIKLRGFYSKIGEMGPGEIVSSLKKQNILLTGSEAREIMLTARELSARLDRVLTSSTSLYKLGTPSTDINQLGYSELLQKLFPNENDFKNFFDASGEFIMTNTLLNNFEEKPSVITALQVLQSIDKDVEVKNFTKLNPIKVGQRIAKLQLLYKDILKVTSEEDPNYKKLEDLLAFCKQQTLAVNQKLPENNV